MLGSMDLHSCIAWIPNCTGLWSCPVRILGWLMLLNTYNECRKGGAFSSVWCHHLLYRHASNSQNHCFGKCTHIMPSSTTLFGAGELHGWDIWSLGCERPSIQGAWIWEIISKLEYGYLALLGLIWLQCYYCVVYDRNSAFTLCWMPTGSFWHKRVLHIGTSTMYEKLTPMCTIPHAWIKNIFCVSSSQNFARSLMRLET